MIRSILVDDEITAIKSLKWEIEKYCPEIEVVQHFTDPVEAISGINTIKPDCVFMDIEMPGLDAFQLLNRLSFKDFDLIFTTAYDNYAIKAFREEATDYLLKPIDPEDLSLAVERVKKRKQENSLGKAFQDLVSNTNLSQKNNDKIPLHFADRTLFLKISEIIFCKSDGNYTEIFLKNGQKEVLSKKLKYVQELINDPVFFRVHHSYLVNLKYIQEYFKNEGHYLVLEDGSSIPVARSRKKELLEFLNS
ncbi:response regulator transcription factor [Gramella sp. BOM4]|nr:response regulator transcription factor [Christiangramia bathymodioli]